MAEYTQGISKGGATILKNGQPLSIDEILAELNQVDALAANIETLKDAALCAVSNMSQGFAKARLFNACQQTPDQSLAKIKAKAVEDFVQSIASAELSHFSQQLLDRRTVYFSQQGCT